MSASFARIAEQLNAITAKLFEEHDAVVEALSRQNATLHRVNDDLRTRLRLVQGPGGNDECNGRITYEFEDPLMVGGHTRPKALTPRPASKSSRINQFHAPPRSPHPRRLRSLQESPGAPSLIEVDPVTSHDISHDISRVRISSDMDQEMEIMSMSEAESDLPPLYSSMISGPKDSRSSSIATVVGVADRQNSDLAISMANSELPAQTQLHSMDSMELNKRRVQRFSIDEVFPPWFNPFVQETYMGRSIGVERDTASVFSSQRPGSEARPPMPSRFVMRPLGEAAMVWTLAWMVALTYELWVFPMEVLFIVPDQMPVTLQKISLATMIFFFFDLIINFFTGYMEQDVEILELTKIAKAYLSGWFWVDLLATVPWHLVMGQGRLLSIGRAGKFFKMMKVVRTLRIMKIFKWSRVFNSLRFDERKLSNGNALSFTKSLTKRSKTFLARFDKQIEPAQAVFPPLGLPIKMLFVLIVLSHLHCVPFALAKEFSPTSDFDLGFRRYLRSIRWFFYLLVFATNAESEGEYSEYFAFLEMVVVTERLFLVSMCLSRHIFRTLVLQQEDSKKALKYRDAIAYLQQHDVSASTRAQVRFNVKQTGKDRSVRQNFLELMSESLPPQLQSQICRELWAKHLKSFGLFDEISKWTESFIEELCMIVTEETYAANIVVFQQNDAVDDAIKVLKGRLVVQSSNQTDPIPDFTAGMWIGEKGLINLGLRRSATCITAVMTSVMNVPAYHFQLLLERLGVLARFQEFCCDELWRGLCGRCGKISHHFSDCCPTVTVQETFWGAFSRATAMSPTTLMRSRTTAPGQLHSIGGTPAASGSHHSAVVSDVRPLNQRPLAHDAKRYLKYHNLEELKPECFRRGVVTLDDLSSFFSQQKAWIDEFLDTTVSEYTGTTAEEVQTFREQMAIETKRMLSLRMSQNDYFVFISHFKVEAGTEAALMRGELQQLIHADEGHPAKDLNTSVFLDAEDLTDLNILLRAVAKSHNLVILLTPGVLTRPWCLMEIATAVRTDVNLVPVLVTKPGSDFIFPDEQFYANFLAGGTVGKDGLSEVMRQGFEMSEVCKAVRKVFDQIAMPYSPHRALLIREAECQNVLRRCVCRAEQHSEPVMRPKKSAVLPTGGRPSTPGSHQAQQRAFGSGNSVQPYASRKISQRYSVDPAGRHSVE